MEHRPADDHFLPRHVQGFTAAATADQRLFLVEELAGFAFALESPEVPQPDIEADLAENGFELEWDIEDEDRFELTPEQIRAGARIRALFEHKRWFFRIRDAESKRIVFQGYVPWILQAFAPRI